MARRAFEPAPSLFLAVEAATTAITSRFGAAGLLGVVTPVWVAVAASSGRLLASSSARPPPHSSSSVG